MKNLLLDKREKMLFENQRGYLLEEQSVDDSVSQESFEALPQLHWEKVERRSKYAKLLTNWTARTPFDKRLLYGVLHKNGPQHFDKQKQDRSMSIKEIRNSIDFEKPEKVVRKPALREDPSADIVSSCSVNGNESSEESFAGAKRIRP